jgi:lactate permease
MSWEQIYAPTGSLPLDTFLAGLPILLLLGLLATGKVSAHASALAGLTAALLVAIFAYVPVMPDTPDYWDRVGQWAPSMLAAAGYGGCFGLLPIGWIVFTAIFLYALTVEAGQFEIVKYSVATLSDDRRIQALLIAFSFGAFVEGAAGFGTPVAISAALMMGAGFRPIYAAGLALLANTSPVAFGALGTPIITLAEVTNLPVMSLSQMAGRQLPFFSLIVPVWLVWVMSGWRGVVGVWPALLVSGGSFALMQFLVANYHGPWLVDVAGGLVSLVALALFMRVWKPKSVWHFPEEQPATATDPAKQVYTRNQMIYAWMPWVLLSVLVFAWGTPQVKDVLNRWTSVSFEVPNLHKKVARGTEVVPPKIDPALVAGTVGSLANPLGQGAMLTASSFYPERTRPDTEKAIYNLGWLSATGTGIFLAAILSALWLRISPRRFLKVFGQTCYRVRWALFTIVCMLAIAFVTRYSGMDASLGLVFKLTGWLYPLFAAMLGWLGVALTGSDTSSNALFGSLQTMTAGQLVADGTLPLEPIKAQVLMATANSTGGVMGKMIDAQSIVVASAATHQHNQEGAILRFVFWHSVILALLMGLLVLFQAYVWTSVIP